MNEIILNLPPLKQNSGSTTGYVDPYLLTMVSITSDCVIYTDSVVHGRMLSYNYAILCIKSRQ